MPEVNAAMTRLVVAHAAVVAVPVLAVFLVLGLWLLALPVALVVAVGVTVWRTRGIDARVARTIDARPVDDDEAPRLAALAETMAMAVGVPVPRLWLIESESGNAVSWGVSNGPSNLAVTTGLLETTDLIGLEAVVGHQLSVVHGRAVEVVTLAAALFGPFARGPLAPVVASLVGADVQQQVERADIAGARTTRYPPAMVGVLDALRSAPTRLEAIPPALTGLCFAAPHHHEGPFSVHPPLDDRIDLLREI
ncbi:MAG: hypothetical protein U5K30_03685 [Acidimicrobiales bacterium]|nr:hypothetical protein [Acidimicrobiales bacterium]